MYCAERTTDTHACVCVCARISREIVDGHGVGCARASICWRSYDASARNSHSTEVPGSARTAKLPMPGAYLLHALARCRGRGRGMVSAFAAGRAERERRVFRKNCRFPAGLDRGMADIRIGWVWERWKWEESWVFSADAVCFLVSRNGKTAEIYYRRLFGRG